ncbi:hypothetical protein [Pantoea septica]|uniref:competence protein CoiA n=1 Tax=Pantoea septica TaxID=472695 RepID=UPI0028A5F675|nr:hypothetical protein [Pantoea septica]
MIYAWIGGQKRQPLEKGEKTECRDCGGTLTAVLPVQNIHHWRHKAGDCDTWSEPEGPWHLQWKEFFSEGCREVTLRDAQTNELHRADILYGQGTDSETVLELQHSPISEEERISREKFYMQGRRMFWLVHLDTKSSSHGWTFEMSLDFKNKRAEYAKHTFGIMHWFGRSTQFIEKWKRSDAHVFFDFKDHIFYLANKRISEKLNNGAPLEKGEFAVCVLTRDKFIAAVQRPRSLR